MHKYFIQFSVLIFSILIHTKVVAQPLYDLNTIQHIEVQFSQANWDYMMDTAKHGNEDYIMAQWVKINGIQYDSVGVKYKGNSSYDSTRIKNPLHISFDEYKSQKHQGYSDIKLSNGYGDPSSIREVMGYNILKNYMHCPKSNFAQLYINGNYIGLYSSAENIDKKFCGDHFYSNYGTFVKCNPVINPSPATKSNLKYINSDSSSYANYYEIKSNTGWNELVKLCDSSSNFPISIQSYTDLDRLIWMLSFNNLLVNLDSYSGVFSQNYYVYRDLTMHYNPIIWDLNMCFGAFPFAGAGANSMGTLTIPNMQQFPITNHLSDVNWPLINAVLTNPSYKKMMVAHMRTILNEQFTNASYKTFSTQLQSLIDTAIQSETNSLFTYTQFLGASNTDYPFGSYTIPGINNLMDARITYLQSTPEFTALPPTITAVTSSTNAPVYNTSFTINATVTNANASTVVIGYRFDKTVKFQKILMYDDGLHNDGIANDQQYGTTLQMAGGEMQYYIYAENTDAAIFSPERAENEFYSLFASSAEPNIGDLVINELLADNTTNVKDEYNDREDWIELYNSTNQVLDLSNVFLSTKNTNLTKWRFPLHTTINPNGYLTIFADDDSLQQILHTNFALNKLADTLYLSKTSNILLDSVSFMNQTSNVSFGRYPNGTGPFTAMNTTYHAENTNFPLSIASPIKHVSFDLFPNPSNDQCRIEFKGGKNRINVYTIYGQKVMSMVANSSFTFSTINWANGIYIVKCGTNSKKLVVQH